MAFEIKVSKADICPLFIESESTFEVSGTHSIERFNRYTRVYLTFPDGHTELYLSTGSLQATVITPYNLSGDTGVMYLEPCQMGIFKLKYIALPSPFETWDEDNPPLYEAGDCFYYNGIIYTVNASSLYLPSEAYPNVVDAIAAFLSTGEISIIDVSQISEKYISEISFLYACNLEPCLLKKLQKINCAIVQEPTRRDICEFEEFDQILYLNAMVYLFENYNSEIASNPEYEFTVNSVANFVNPICCCNGKPCK